MDRRGALFIAPVRTATLAAHIAEVDGVRLEKGLRNDFRRVPTSRPLVTSNSACGYAKRGILQASAFLSIRPVRPSPHQSPACEGVIGTSVST